MNFLDISSLWHLLWILPIFIALWYVGVHRAKHKITMIFPDREQASHFIDLSPAKRNLRIILLACAVICIIIAIARPTWGKQIVPETSAGRDLLVVFDVSRSMLADDVKPSRFTHGKWVVRELVKQNPGDRFGLIAFAGTAFLSCPLTADRTSFIQLVDELDTNSIPLGGTNVQKALETAVKAFAGAEGTHKAVILITDGDELEGRGASVVTDLKNAGIPLIIAGIGDPSVPSVIRVPDENGQPRILTDSDGNAVKSLLNEEQLGALARSTNGIYVRSTSAEDGIEHLEARIRMLDRKENKEELGMFRPIERPVYPIAGALFFLILFFCIPETRKLAVMLFACFFCVQTYAQNVTESASAPDESASQTPEQESETESDHENGKKTLTATDLFNRGFADQTEKHDNESAKTNYELSISLAQKEPAARASSYQNIGVLTHNEARESVQKAMEDIQNQKLDEAKKNVEQALLKLNQTEEHYCESMRSVSSTGNPGVLRNQQILLQDRRNAEELKAKIEELQRLQQQAAQQTQQALNQQQQENQQQNQDRQNQEQDQQQQNQDQQQQDQQNQDQQQQDQQNSQDQQNKSASERTQDAKHSASELEKKASDMKQENLQQAAQQAKQELEQAQEAQSKGDGKSAEEHLQNALKSLKPENQKEDKQENDSEDEQGEKNDSKEQQNKPEEKDNGQEAQSQQAETEKKDQPIDKQQAEAILNSMTNDEKDARDKMRLQQRNSSYGKVEKDW